MVDFAGNTYWTERSFLDRVLSNYNGSVYIIQGMQDWNVDPHMAFPIHQQIADAGIEIKTLAGQWAHDYPDRVEGHSSQGAEEDKKHTHTPSDGIGAYDEMLYWFDWYLKGEGRAPTLGVEMQDNRGGWRFETTWPSEDTNYVQTEVYTLEPNGALMGVTRAPITFSYISF